MRTRSHARSHTRSPTRSTLPALAAAAVTLALASCSRAPEGGAAVGPGPKGEVVAEGRLTDAQKAQAARAAEARDALAGSLLAELTGALDAGGPTAAIAVCKERAPAIAREVSARTGVRIARTSFKLRNPANAPPAWAADLVERRVSEPTHVALADGALGALLPIKTAAPCLGCHGEAERIPPEVGAALAASYPADRATGFRSGDLRGWFWVEVPKAR